MTRLMGTRTARFSKAMRKTQKNGVFFRIRSG
jgi:hypothetical protein